MRVLQLRNFCYTKLIADAVNEIKSNFKPSFNHPYLWVTIQNTLRVRGLYDTEEQTFLA